MSTTAMDVVRAFVGAINRRSPTDIADLMTADHMFVDSAGGVMAGREKMTGAWKEYFRLFPDYSIRIESILDDGPLVAVFGIASGTYSGKRGPVAANRIEMPAAWRAVVEDDRVKLWQVYADWTEGHRIIAEDARAG
jgi:ketosteroid isomerase-like protein